MTDMRFDRAPGDRPILTDREAGTPAGVLVYTIGLVLAVLLTATSGTLSASADLSINAAASSLSY